MTNAIRGEFINFATTRQRTVDELTMRSEVPRTDAEAPVTPSHPSFDDDAAPCPAGPHPRRGTTRAPIGPRIGHASSTSDAQTSPRARLQPVPVHHSSASTMPPSSPTPARLDQPVRRRWLLWSSLAVLAVVFGAVGFRVALRLPTPISASAVVREQYGQVATARPGVDACCRRPSGCGNPRASSSGVEVSVTRPVRHDG